jgi:RNA polymerase sigma-70 factor (ECF subfamily)
MDDITIAVLEAARAGDHSAERVLMQQLYKPVYHFLRKRTGDIAITDDLCQTVFLKVYEKIDTYDPGGASVAVWVFRVARNTLIDHYRKHTADRLSENYEPVATDSSSDAAGLAMKWSNEQEVARLLATLPVEVADVVTLRAIDEMSYDSIAQIIGKSPEATRQLYSRALSSLRGLVQKDNI